MDDSSPRLWVVEDHKLHLHFNAAQTAAWNSPARFTFLVSGTRAGKTSLAPFWLHREIMETAIADPVESNDYLAMTSTNRLFDNAFRPALQTIFEHVLIRKIGKQIVSFGRYWPSMQLFELSDPKRGFWANKASGRMWGRVLLRTAEAWQSAEGFRARAAVLDEAGQASFNLSVWEAVLRRVAQDRARVLIPTTPYSLGWMHDLYRNWQNRARGYEDFNFLQFPSTVNPSFPSEEFERARGTMAVWRFNMMYRGVFERPAGLIYGDFDERYHWIDPVPLDPSWPTYVGIDPGPLHTGVVWVTERPGTSTFYLRQEYLEGNKASPQHAADVLERSRGMNVVAWAMGAKSEHQYRWDWQVAGVPASEPLVSEVEGRIDRVTAMLKQKRLFVFNTCPHIKDELATYSRVLDSSGQPTEGIADKAQYHLLDALGYASGDMADPPGIGVVVYEPDAVAEEHPPEDGGALPEWYTSLRAWKEVTV